MKKTTLLILIVTVSSIFVKAQNQLSIPNVLPAAAKQTQSTSAGTHNMFAMFEQFGDLPNDETMACKPPSVGTIHVKVEYYASGAGKYMFDQIIQSKRLETDMAAYEEGYKTQKAQYTGNDLNNVSDLTKKDADGGKQLSYIITAKACEDAPPYIGTLLSYYLIKGTAIIYVDMNYYGKEEDAEKYRKEVVENVGKIALDKL